MLNGALWDAFMTMRFIALQHVTSGLDGSGVVSAFLTKINAAEVSTRVGGIYLSAADLWPML